MRLILETLRYMCLLFVGSSSPNNHTLWYRYLRVLHVPFESGAAPPFHFSAPPYNFQHHLIFSWLHHVIWDFDLLLATFYLQNAGYLMVNQDKWNMKLIICNIRGEKGQEGIKAVFIANDSFRWLLVFAKCAQVL